MGGLELHFSILAAMKCKNYRYYCNLQMPGARAVRQLAELRELASWKLEVSDGSAISKFEIPTLQDRIRLCLKAVEMPHLVNLPDSTRRLYTRLG